MITKLNINQVRYSSESIKPKESLKDIETSLKGFKEGIDSDGNPCLQFSVISSKKDGMNARDINITISKSFLRSIIDAIKIAFGGKSSTEDAQIIIEKVMAKIAKMPEGPHKDALIQLISSDKGAEELNLQFSTLIHLDSVHDTSAPKKEISMWDIKVGGSLDGQLFVANQDHHEKIAKQIFSQLENISMPLDEKKSITSNSTAVDSVKQISKETLISDLSEINQQLSSDITNLFKSNTVPYKDAMIKFSEQVKQTYDNFFSKPENQIFTNYQDMIDKVVYGINYHSGMNIVDTTDMTYKINTPELPKDNFQRKEFFLELAGVDNSDDSVIMWHFPVSFIAQWND